MPTSIKRKSRMRSDSKPPAVPTIAPGERSVFVAYAYSVHNKEDYRAVFRRLEKLWSVRFIFADEKISSSHILEKIEGYIKTSKIGLYDVTQWNPNVALELGIAYGLRTTRYILLDTSRNQRTGVPSDLGGFDRVEFGSYKELEERLSEILTNEFPRPVKTNYLLEKRNEVRDLLRGSTKALGVGEIARAIGETTAVTQIILAPLVDDNIVEKTGIARGTKYIIPPRRGRPRKTPDA